MSRIDDIEKKLKRGDKLLDSELAQIEKELVSNYKSALRNIRSQIMAVTEQYGDQVKLEELLQYNRLTNLEINIARELKDLGVTVKKLTSSSIKDFFSESFYRTGYALETGIGAKLGFGLLDKRVIEESLLNPLDRIKTWPERLKENINDTNNKLRGELTQGLIKGEGLSKVSARVTERLGISANNSIRIVRTETHRAQNQGRLRAFDKTESAAGRLGLKIRRQWVAVKDSRTRSDHSAANGKLTNDENKFELFGTVFDGPGLSGIPGEDINCRCTTVVSIEGINDVQPDKALNYESYDEWYSGRIK